MKTELIRRIAVVISASVGLGAPSLAMAQEPVQVPVQVPASTTTSTTTSTTYATTTAVTTTAPATPVSIAAPPAAPIAPARPGTTLAIPATHCMASCEPVEVITRYEDKPRYGLMISGGAVFGALWLLTALPLTVSQRDAKLAIPIVGPFVMAAKLDGTAPENVLKFWLAVDGLGQAAMLTMFIAGAMSKRRTPVYERMVLLPSAGPNGAGVTAAGRF